jgi:uncharacterized RDD family membrane protein YckC
VSASPGNFEPPLGAEPTQVVRSPEQVALHFPIAGPTSRMLAYGIDLIAVGLLELALFVLLMLVTPLASATQRWLERFSEDLDPANQEQIAGFMLAFFAMMILFQMVVEWGYFTFFEMAMGGRSPGKRVLGLRVMRDGGLPLTLRESLLRNLMRTVDMLPAQYLIGLVAMVMSNEGKRLGDLVAGTIVVRNDAAPAPRPLPARDAGASSAFRFERAQLERIGAAEGALIRQALRRSEEFARDQSDAIIARAVEALCAKLPHGPVPPAEQRAFLLALLDAVRGR